MSFGGRKLRQLRGQIRDIGDNDKLQFGSDQNELSLSLLKMYSEGAGKTNALVLQGFRPHEGKFAMQMASFMMA
jgi:hypothetical protein